MFAKKRNLFRQEALERLSSPERLDQVMQVVSSKDWLALSSLGSLLLVALLWSIFGRISITAEGRGILLYPRQVVELQSPSAGQLQTLNVKVGDTIRKGDILGLINQAELQKQLQQQQAKLAQLQEQDRNFNALSQERIEQEKKAIQQQRQTLQQRLQDLQALTSILKDRELSAIGQQRQTLQQQLQDLQALVSVVKERELSAIEEQRRMLQQRLQDRRELEPVFQERLAQRKKLRAEGAIADDAVLEAEQSYRENRNQSADIQAQLQELNSKAIGTEKSYRENRNQISNIQAQLQELNRKEIETEKNYRENRSQISDLQAQLKELDSKEKDLAQQTLESATNRTNQIQDVKREIAQLTVQLQVNSEIVSKYNGRVLELAVTPGQVVSPGTPIGTLVATESSTKLMSVNYFSVKDGKQIAAGMKIQITPDTVKREEFGGILGRVTSVSPFAVTKEGLQSLVGNAEVAESLMSKGGQIEILADLQPDNTNVSGYKWSSSAGPRSQISPGTTTSVRVTVAQQAPITFILPILKAATGID